MMKEETKNLLVPLLKEDCTLSEGSRIEDLRDLSGRDIVEVSPCTSERGKLMAEIDFSGVRKDHFLDLDVLGLLLDSYKGHFAEMKFSPKLGLGRVMWKAHRIYIYQKGKFKIRFAHSREDAIKTLNSLLRLIQGSIICEKCGNPTTDCILGKCDVCNESNSPRVLNIEDHFNGPLLLKGYESLKKALENSQKLEQELSQKKGVWPTNLENNIKRNLKEAIEYSMNFSLESPIHEDSYIGVEIIAIARENLFLLNQEHALVETLYPGLSKEAKPAFYRLNKIPWELSENLLKALFNEEEIEKKILEERISEFEASLREIRNMSIEDSEKELKKLEKIIQTNLNFLRKLNT